MKWPARIKQVGRPSAVALLAAVAQAAGGAVALAVAYPLAAELREGGFAVAALLAGVGVVGCGCFVLPTNVLSLVAGWSLGAGPGTLLAVAAATGGACVSWGSGRRRRGSSR